MANPPTRRRLSIEERRTQLVRTALTLFADRAPEEVGIDDIARTAGVSRPLVYHYFPGGKAQLYESALRSAAEDLRGCFAHRVEGPLPHMLAEAVGGYLAFVDAHDTSFRALSRGGRTVDVVRMAAARHIHGLLEITEPGLRLRMTVRMWIAAVETASTLWLAEHKQPPLAELKATLTEQFMVMLMATAALDAQTAQAVRELSDRLPMPRYHSPDHAVRARKSSG
ncbi:helix-turn-helix domain-containing protein [Streptomyces sp. NPDC005865]|uniref:TetR/AcrR family transcriptional regulator n=1 Tax=Streptomyces sp. NPDC005865 TaxID=3155453 RepID=UPI0033CC5B7E